MCEHKEFKANVAVNRMEDIGTFAADIKIWCVECDIPFQFIGLPGGLAPNYPTTSVDETEARMPIAPYGQEITAMDEYMGFKIKRVK